VTCYLPALTAEKTAAGTYDRTVTWTLDKSVDDAEHTGFAGEVAGTSNWTVFADKTEVSDNYKVTGSISIHNPAAIAQTFAVSDELNDGTLASVTCPTDTVPAGGTVKCTYTALPSDDSATLNTATVSAAGNADQTATAAVSFTENLIGFDSGTLSDDNAFNPNPPTVISGDTTWNYGETFTCSSDPADYGTNGEHLFNVPNTATLNGNINLSDTENVTVTCYAPVISKDADGSYDEYHDWTVDKSVDPTQQSAFAGDTVYFDWTVVVDEDVWEENFLVTGQISVYNPAPMPMTVELTDVLGDGTVATITSCSDTGVTWDGINLYIPAGFTAICDYEATPSGGPNSDPDLEDFAAALPDQVQFKVQYPYGGGDAYFPTVTVAGGTVLDGTYDGWCLDTDNVIYQNTWYNANIYSSYEDLSGKVEYPENMDLVNWIVNQDFVGQPSPGCDGNYTYGDVQRAIWELIEDTPSTAGLGSWSQCRVAEILAAAQASGEGFTPACGDYIAVVLEPVTGQQMIAIAQVSMLEIGLECPVSSNTATATLNGIDFSASADIEWTKNIIHGGVTLDDDQNDAWPIELTDGGEWTYGDSYTCSSNPADYVDGGGTTYQATIENLATLYDGDEFLDDGYVSTLVDCYIPTIDKTAAGTYDERHEWTVDKTVDPLEQGGFPGSVLDWIWTVYVYEEVYEENFDVAGTITVVNPNPEDDLEVALNDELSDLTVVDITGCVGGTYTAGILTVPPSGTAVCEYEANDMDYIDDAAAPDINYATITLNGIDFTAQDAIEYTANRIRENATLTDDEIGLNVSLTGNSQAGNYTFGPYTGDDIHTCSENRADYFVEGVYTQMTDTIINWAYVYSDSEEQHRDDATTTWTCDASFVDILKTTNDVIDPTKDIRFKLYNASGMYLNDEVSTLNDEDGLLQFTTALVPGDSYTVCEAPVPAGYTFEITVNNDNVLSYAGPPGAVDPTGEIQCFDFVAADSPTTLLFEVNNSYPGGAPRTPGYWKNWNTCSGGNQAETAAALGGKEEGVFILDDLLPQTLGDYLTIVTCEDGVLILDARDLMEVDKRGNPINRSNDAAYTLARALLAARLNQDAGACPAAEFDFLGEYGFDGTFEQLLTAADDVLSQVEFDGSGSFLSPKDLKGKNNPLVQLAEEALFLYGIIDDYNNGEICTGEPSH
jgi:hypothetical protein